MAYLYETVTWRAIVRATRDPKIMMMFAIGSTGSAYLVAKATQLITDPIAEETKSKLEKTIEKDYESARYARHSKNALAVLIDSYKSGDDAQSPVKAKHNIKLPGVMWHPKIAKQEREQLLAAEKAKNSQQSSNASRESQLSR